MKFLLFVSLIAIFIVFSCKTKPAIPSQAVKIQKFESQQLNVYWKKGRSDSSFKFYTKAVIYGKEIQGILFVKRMSESLYKTSFLAKGALKLFEMDLMPDTFIVHNRAKEIDKPIVLKTIADDLKLLTFQIHKEILPNSVLIEPNQTTVREPFHKTSVFYIFDSQNQLKELITTGSNNSRNISVVISNYQNGIPENINLKHHRFKLKIDLTLAKD